MRRRTVVVLNLLVLVSKLAVAQSRVPLTFEPNLGQANTAAEFVAHTPQCAAQFDPSGVTLRRGGDTIRMAFGNANPATRLRGLGPTGGSANYFIGPKANWIGGIPLFLGVRYAEVYPGIDVDFHSPGGSPGESPSTEHGGDLEYDFLLAPGAKVSAIRLVFSGIQTTYLDRGDLVLKTAQGEFRHRHPRLYRERNGKRLEIGGGYVLRDWNEVGFEVAPGWADSPMVIDPVLTYSTFMGGSGNTMAWALAVDSADCIYLAGETLPVDFGATFQVSDSTSSTDAFLVKMNSTGTAMVYAAYFGGTGRSSARGVAVDSGGNAYITGFAYSTDFPTTAGAYRSSTLGMADVFAMKVNPTGSALVYSALFGGAGIDLATGIAIDSSGNAYISGSTASLAFPITNAFQSSYGGGVQDAFVTKINATGSALLYSTFLGGTGNDVANGIAVDSSGSVYVAGYTDSLNFPVASALYGAPAGQGDAFVAKLTPSGTGLVFATYLGGSQVDVASAIAIDSVDDVFVTGTTLSTDFPVTAGAFQTGNAGSYDAFVTELNSEGSALVYSTYLGGEGSDQANAIAVHSDVAYVAGFTYSHYYPVQEALQSALGGAQDAFVTVIAAGGGSLVWSTYFGGLEDDQANGIAVDSSASAYIAGWTLSSNFPVSGGAFQTTYAVESGFLVKLSTTTVTAANPLQLVPVAPCRVIDTRNADGPLGGPYIAGGSTRAIPIPS
ncbi:MAG: SBBP repeat-containing protein, partial [Bryobacteraceae bacterium]